MNRGVPVWAKLVIAAFLLLVVGVVGGPYVYIHFIEGKAPAPLSVNTSNSSTASSDSSSSSSIDGTWKVGSGSVVGYRVNETLFGQSNTATGRTSSVTGSLTVAGHTATAGSFTADLTTVASDKAQRDRQFQGRIMNTATFPTATFKLSQPLTLSAVPTDNAIVDAKATGTLTMHGVTKPVTFDLKAQRDGADIKVNGSIPIVFADYNIANPSAGPATTEDHGVIEFLVVFAKS
jgi:polyisoprenoid-binding protein YceI